MRIVPLTGYRYCWSAKVADLLFKAKELANAEQSSIAAFLEEAQYQESDLEGAYRAGHEIMLSCDLFVAIPVSLLDSLGSNKLPTEEKFLSGIILPT